MMPVQQAATPQQKMRNRLVAASVAICAVAAGSSFLTRTPETTAAQKQDLTKLVDKTASTRSSNGLECVDNDGASHYFTQGQVKANAKSLKGAIQNGTIEACSDKAAPEMEFSEARRAAGLAGPAVRASASKHTL